MKIVLVGDNGITLLASEGMLTIEAENEDHEFSAFHMLAASLATCTFAVLHSWAHHSSLPADDLRLHVTWEFGEDPHRLTDMRTRIEWPSLPEARHVAAQRAAALCAVHQTLTHPVHIDTVLGS